MYSCTGIRYAYILNRNIEIEYLFLLQEMGSKDDDDQISHETKSSLNTKMGEKWKWHKITKRPYSWIMIDR